MKYAMGEKEILVQRKAKEDAEKKVLVKGNFHKRFLTCDFKPINIDRQRK